MFWQFKNGSVVALDFWEWLDIDEVGPKYYCAWDRSLGANLYYER